MAACVTDARNPDLIEHEVETLGVQRVVGIALGYEDLIDHDQLRHDPVMATLAGKLTARRAGCAPLAGAELVWAVCARRNASSRVGTAGRGVQRLAPTRASGAGWRGQACRRWNSAPQNCGTYATADRDRWAALVRDAGITAES